MKTVLDIISDSASAVAAPDKLTMPQWEAAARALANIAALRIEIQGRPETDDTARLIREAVLECLRAEGFDPNNWFVLVHPHIVPERVISLPFRRWRVHTRLVAPERAAGITKVTIAEKTHGT